MTPHDAFLKAILDAPLADEPRLSYASWLEERRDPRGEFISLQCRLARCRPAREFFELECRQKELLGDFEREWAEPIPALVDLWAFHRGFVEEIAVSAEGFLSHAESFFQQTPLAQVHLRKVAERLPALAVSPCLRRLHFLDLSSNHMGDIGIRLLCKSPHLAGLRGLNLSSTASGDAGAQALAESPHLNGLEELYLSDNDITDQGARALAASPHLQGLKTLFVDDNKIREKGRTALTRRFGTRVHIMTRSRFPVSGEW